MIAFPETSVLVGYPMASHPDQAERASMLMQAIKNAELCWLLVSRQPWQDGILAI